MNPIFLKKYILFQIRTSSRNQIVNIICHLLNKSDKKGKKCTEDKKINLIIQKNHTEF